MAEHSENRSERGRTAPRCQAPDINDKLIINLRDLSHIMRSLYEGRASQKNILIVLRKVGSITQRELTARLGIQPGSASEILSKLENAGLIVRTESKTDRRTSDISLTDRGEQMAREAAEQRSRRHVEMFSCLSGGEKEELLSLLEKVHEDWECRYRAAEGHSAKNHPQVKNLSGPMGANATENAIVPMNTANAYRHNGKLGAYRIETEDGNRWENM